jgi:hypothetical protein
MRVIVAALLTLIAVSAANTAQADPYRWCAVYGGGDNGGGVNCYFLTLEQCRAAVSGTGGFCEPNQFYTGERDDVPRRRVRPPR